MDSNSATPAAPCTFTGSGSYSISSSGYGFLTNPLKPGDLIWGMVSQTGVFVGSTTENTTGYNDLFIGAPVGSGATLSTFSGAYSVAYLNFPDGFITDLTTAGFQLNPNNGSLGAVNIQAYKGTSSVANVSEQPVNYSISNGAFVLTFPPIGPVILNQEYLYITPDGNLVFGGSPSGYDIFFGVRTGTGQSQFAGLFYQAGLDDTLSTIDTTVYGSIQSYYGTFNAVDGNSISHQRILAPLRPQPQPVGFFAPPYGYTSASRISVAFGSGGGYTDPASGRQYVIGANGTVRIGFGVTPALGIGVALQAPSSATTPVAGAPFIDPAGIANAGSYAPFTAGISPGELISIFGANFPSGVQVTVNNTPAAVQAVSANQIVATVPFNITGPYAQIQVGGSGAPSNVVWEPVNLTTPGVFSQAENGIGDAEAFHANFSLVTPANPAQPGETIIVFATGLGVVNTASPLGSFGSYVPANSITATIGGMNAAVTYPSLSPLLAGVDEIDLTIPSGLTAGENPLVISGPDSRAAQTTIAIGSGH